VAVAGPGGGLTAASSRRGWFQNGSFESSSFESSSFESSSFENGDDVPNMTIPATGADAFLGFHPVAMCLRPGDEEASAEALPVRICFRPGDEEASAEVRLCFRPGDEEASDVRPVAICFHPGDETAVVGEGNRPVSPCHHPVDDLASDLHLALTGIDERQLAAVAARRP
jgi:hypothetical protein